MNDTNWQIHVSTNFVYIYCQYKLTSFKILRVVNTGRPQQVKYWGGRDPCNPCGVDAYVSPVISHAQPAVCAPPTHW